MMMYEKNTFVSLLFVVLCAFPISVDRGVLAKKIKKPKFGIARHHTNRPIIAPTPENEGRIPEKTVTVPEIKTIPEKTVTVPEIKTIPEEIVTVPEIKTIPEEIVTVPEMKTTREEIVTVSKPVNEIVVSKEVNESIVSYTRECSTDFRNNATSIEEKYITKNYVENIASYEGVLSELLDVDWKEDIHRRELTRIEDKKKEREEKKKEFEARGKKMKQHATLKPPKKDKSTTQVAQMKDKNKIEKVHELGFKQKRTKVYFSNRKFQWKLLLTWLIETNETLSSTDKRLKDFGQVYKNSTLGGLTMEIFIDWVLNSWVDPSKATKFSSEIDVKKLYNAFVSIMSKEKIETSCADLISKIFIAVR